VKFERHIGIDYSGARASESRLKGLQVYETRNGLGPRNVATPTQGARNWSRLEVAQYCATAILSTETVIIGIDHAFSFLTSYFERTV